MGSTHSSEPDSDERCGPEPLDSLNSTSFFHRANNISSAKKLDLPSSSETIWKYRVPSEICKICRDVIQRISKITATGSSFDVEYHQTYAAVKSSAGTGCGTCSMFFREFRLERQDKEEPDKSKRSSWINATGSSFTWAVTIPWLEGDPNPGAICMEIGDPGERYCFQARIESFLAVSQSMMLFCCDSCC